MSKDKQPPVDVMEAYFEKEYPKKEQSQYDTDKDFSYNELQEYRREAALFGYNLLPKIDWEKVKDEWTKEKPLELSEIGLNKILNFFKENIISAGAKDKWISVDDSLPKDGQDVLIGADIMVVASTYSNIGHFGRYKNHISGDRCASYTYSNVKKWQPLPEPPKQ